MAKTSAGSFARQVQDIVWPRSPRKPFIVKGGDDNENRYVKTLLVRKRASQLSASDPSTIYRFPSTYLDRAVQSKLQTVCEVVFQSFFSSSSFQLLSPLFYLHQSDIDMNCIYVHVCKYIMHFSS